MNAKYAAFLTVTAADAAALVLLIVAAPWLTARFAYDFVQDLTFTAIGNALLLAAGVVLFLIGIAILMKTRPVGAPRQTWLVGRVLRGTVAALFALVIAFALGDLAGFLGSADQVNFGELGNSTYFLFSGGVFLFFPLIYLLILVTDVDATIAADDRGRLFVSVLLQNCLLIAVTAYLAAAVDRFGVDSRAARALLGGGLTALLFAYPRLLTADKLAQPAVSAGLVALLVAAVSVIVA